MIHQIASFCIHWVAPLLMGGFFAVLPHLLNNLKPGKH